MYGYHEHNVHSELVGGFHGLLKSPQSARDHGHRGHGPIAHHETKKEP